jgi:mono/diheme cytochrome c family protein
MIMNPSSTQTSFASFVFGALFVLTMIAVSTGCQPQPTPVTGQQIYTRYCAQCHQAEGNGIERAFPPIRGTEWVNGDKGRLIRLVLYGMQGPIEVQGQTYNNAMTPHGFLTDEQVAAVLTFVRSSFENDADPVLPDEVARVRAAEGERGLFLASDLQNRLGIPDMDSTAVAP